jgi:membrane-associated phospholipid phosphatase
VSVPDWVILVYLGYLAAILPLRPLSASRRLRFLLGAVPLAGAVAGAAACLPPAALRLVRLWLPLASALLCYWLAGLFFVSPQPAMEDRFIAFDRRVGVWEGKRVWAVSAPRLVLECAEAAYFGGYLILPVGILALIGAGRTDQAARFWTVVLLAVLGCYAVLPWIRTRPPWRVQGESPLDRRPLVMRRLNMFFVLHTSTKANTFPSGHVAGAFGTAFAVLSCCPVTGVWFVVGAIGVAVGTIVGEYHYAVDAVAGALVALAAWGLVALAGL